MYKMIGADGQEYGPVTAEQLRQWMAEGRINGQTQVQPVGAAGWQSLSTLPELAAMSPAVPPAMPPTTSLPVPANAPTSGLAIASLVLGCLGICPNGLTSIIGLILGLVGLNKINKSNGTVGGKRHRRRQGSRHRRHFRFLCHVVSNASHDGRAGDSRFCAGAQTIPRSARHE
jgi:hypothetical protein